MSIILGLSVAERSTFKHAVTLHQETRKYTSNRVGGVRLRFKQEAPGPAGRVGEIGIWVMAPSFCSLHSGLPQLCASHSPMPPSTPSAPSAPICIHLHRQSAQPRNHLPALFAFSSLSRSHECQLHHPVGCSGINLELRCILLFRFSRWPGPRGCEKEHRAQLSGIMQRKQTALRMKDKTPPHRVSTALSLTKALIRLSPVFTS